MTTEQIEQNTRRLFEIVNSGDLSGLDEIVDQNYTYRNTSGEETQGIDEFKNLWSMYDDAFSDLNFELQEVFAKGNRGVAVYRQTGTHTGEFSGIEASNNDIDVLICSIGTFDDNGKLVDAYDVVDTLDLMNQLGALPEEFSGLGAGGAQRGV